MQWLRRLPGRFYDLDFFGLYRVFTQKVHVPNNSVLGIWVIVITVQFLGKYMIIGYLDPEG